MNFLKTDIAGVVVIEPSVFADERGYFFESYNEAEFVKNGIPNRFVQDNQSQSCYGVLRGLHAQAGAHAQAKLIRVLEGKALDIAVDIRANSPTFGKYAAVELSAENKRQLFIPRGFLHGFAALSETAVLTYKCDNLYCKEAEIAVRYNDADIGIDWRIPPDKMIISEKDRNAKGLKDVAHYRL